MSEQREPFPNHTVAGKLHVIATICAAIASFVFVVLWMDEFLPPGRYPLALALSAVAPAAGAFYAVTALLLRLLGIPTRKASS